MNRTTQATLVLALLLGGCVIQSDKYPRSRDLPPQWRVTGLRLLAIRADPPEIRPGQTAAIERLLVDPLNEVQVVLWTACPELRATPFGCPLDLQGLDLETATPEQLREAGVIGIEPFLLPTVIGEESTIAHLGDAQRLEGAYLQVNALALPEGSDFEQLDFNMVESAFKRVVISEATTPNHNPGIDAFTVDGVQVPEQTTVVLQVDQPYEISVDLTDDAIETYTYLNRAGETEQRIEEPFAEWYSSGGKVDEFNTLHPYLPSTFFTPQERGVEGTWWVVIKDRRGGISWTSRRWRTE
jgi:hypothetical protein